MINFKLLLIVVILLTGVNSIEYIKNQLFRQNNCDAVGTPTYNYPYCNPIGATINFWTGSMPDDSQSYFLLFNKYFWAADDNGALLAYLATSTGTLSSSCAKQIINFIPAGMYILNVPYYPHPYATSPSSTNGGDSNAYDLFKYTVILRDPSGKQIFRQGPTSSISIGLNTINIDSIFIPYDLYGGSLTICDSSTHSTYTIALAGPVSLTPNPSFPLSENCRWYKVSEELSEGPIKYICILCPYGYIFSWNLSVKMYTCVTWVEYCQFYNQSLTNNDCIKCIDHFVLKNNTCKPDTQSACNQKDPQTNKCKKCKNGYILNNDGNCDINKNCSSTQYRNALGQCVDGTIQNCLQYRSPSGLCDQCQEGFKFNKNFECILSQITCPNGTETQKYFISNNECVKTDENCVVSNEDGTCPICAAGFYSNQEGICKPFDSDKVPGSQVLLLTDELGAQYSLNSDNSRSYFSGIWTGLTVFTDERGDLYLPKPEIKGREYLSGLFRGRIAFQDSKGDWYSNNSDQSRIYLTGEFEGLTVVLDQKLNIYVLS